MKNFLLSFLALFFTIQTLAAGVQGDFKDDSRRGHPGEFDPGPAKDSEWVRLFGSIPNYRALGQLIIGGQGEKFRWQMGPMWYRGRLAENQVKVFIVGQEGAQDENISNRAFTGSTGTKTQNFLNHLGITESYLFLNTFVYTINGQRDTENDRYMWMEQNLNSPIVKYRHQLFDNMARTNPESLRLILGVGGGAKASVRTWIESHGGKCKGTSDSAMATCYTEPLRKKFGIRHEIKVLGVPHPGSAGKGGNPGPGYQAAADLFEQWVRQQDGAEWFQPDVSWDAMMKNLNTQYVYQKDAPIPHKDFAFGTNWRMGASGTTSNRWGADSIQVFSRDGEYAYKSNSAYKGKPLDNEDKIDLIISKSNLKQILGMEPGDVGYEPPKWYSNKPNHAKQYDYGPCGEAVTSCELSRLLQEWPNFYKSAAPVNAPDFGHGPVYRGRLQDARVLVIADQSSHDDMFSARALTGEVGQKLQNWLNVTGVGSSYVIIRTLPVDTLGQSPNEVQKLALQSDVADQRQRILDAVLSLNKTRVVVTLGSVAQAVAKTHDLGDVEVVNLQWPSSSSLSQWNSAAEEVASAAGTQVNGSYNGRLTAIPREDLPVHTRWWMGTSGDRAQRGEEVGAEGIYYRFSAPGWSRKQPAQRLSGKEKAEIEALLEEADLGEPSDFGSAEE